VVPGALHQILRAGKQGLGPLLRLLPVEGCDLLAGQAHQGIAVLQGVVHEGEGVVPGQGHEPQGQLGQVDGEGVLVHSVQAALGH